MDVSAPPPTSSFGFFISGALAGAMLASYCAWTIAVRQTEKNEDHLKQEIEVLRLRLSGAESDRRNATASLEASTSRFHAVQTELKAAKTGCGGESKLGRLIVSLDATIGDKREQLRRASPIIIRTVGEANGEKIQRSEPSYDYKLVEWELQALLIQREEARRSLIKSLASCESPHDKPNADEN